MKAKIMKKLLLALLFVPLAVFAAGAALEGLIKEAQKRVK